MSEKTVHTFKKNTVEEVRVFFSEYKGHELINIRIFFEAEPDKWIATKKGICLSPELLPELEKALAALKKAAAK